MGTNAIARALVAATSALALLTPAAGAAATTIPGTKISVPASALPHTGSTGTLTERAPSTSTPNGAQPGNVAPGAAGSTQTTTAPADGGTATGTGTTGVTGGGTGTTGTTGTTGVAPTTVAPGTPATLGIVRRPSPKHADKGLSGVALVLAAIGALLVLASLIWAISRWLALQPRWASSLMYSLREASYHASATWAEFSDWARIGR